jgi:eukaryotic-like serine/threonine-protein kinase
VAGPTLNASAGGYRLLDFLGSGGMGEVYRAVHSRLGRIVAVKILSGPGHNADFLQRFQNEARLQATLQHPNIATLYDFLEFDGRPSIVMEFVEGQSLADILRQRWRLPAREALVILRDIASAIAYVHEKGIVHRDIKPGNVRITPSGLVKVLDFGIAKAVSVPGLTQTGFLVGTPHYLAPEQFTSGCASPESDVWALGVVLYEMVTGRLPFEGDFAGQIWKQIDTGAYAKVTEVVVPDSPSDAEGLRLVDGIVGRCLKKNPSHRYQSVPLLQEDVSRALESAGAERRWFDLFPGAAILMSGTRVSLRSPSSQSGMPDKASAQGSSNLFASAASDALGLFERYWPVFVAAAAILLVVLVVFFTASSRSADSHGAAEEQVRSVHRIDVTEGQADVYVNGVHRGRTPFDYPAADEEIIELELRQPGFLSQRERFEITERRVWTFAMKRDARKE